MSLGDWEKDGGRVREGKGRRDSGFGMDGGWRESEDGW